MRQSALSNRGPKKGERKITMKTRISRLIARFLVLSLCVGLLSAIPAHAAETGGLNGDVCAESEFDESVYDEVVFVSTVKNMKVNGYTWPASGTILLEVSSSTYTLDGSKPNCKGITIPGGLVVDIYKYYYATGYADGLTYKLLGHFDTRDGKPYTIGSGSSNSSGTTGATTTVAGFKDVKSTDHFADAVQWAKEVGVTNGTTATTFSPNATVTRAQAVTFLWRAMGKPEPLSNSSPFTDVSDTGAYYYKPVLWAAEKGITNGVSSTLFDVNGTLNYDHILAFLCRASGGNASGSSWSDAAVTWAKENGVSQGLTFSAKAGCPRSNVVYFLWKQLSGKTYPVDQPTNEQTTGEQPSQVPVGLSDLEGARAAIINGFMERSGEIQLSSYNVEASAVRKMMLEIADKDGKNPYRISTLACNEKDGRRALTIGVGYLMQTDSETYTTNEEIRELAANIAKDIVTPGMSEYEIAKALHDWLVLNCHYDRRLFSGNMPDISYTAYGPLKYGTAVCAGYAKAYMALLEVSGLECVYVTGGTTQGRHGWNLVRIDGEWYHVDTTWDDPNPDREGAVRYNYFLKSDHYMSSVVRDHFNWEEKHACTSTKYDPVIPSSDDQKKQEEQKKQQEALDAAIKAKVQEIVDLCCASIATSDVDDLVSVMDPSTGRSEGRLRVPYDPGNIAYGYISKCEAEIDAAIRAKYPDCEVTSLGSRSVSIRSQSLLDKQSQKKQEQKKEEEQKQERENARVQEVEKLIQNAILNTTQKQFQYTLPGEYTSAEISSALAKMRKADYSFGDYTGADYSLSYASYPQVLIITNNKWDREQREQQAQQQEREKEETIEALVAHYLSVIEKLPAPEDMEKITSADVYKKIDSPEGMSGVTATVATEAIRCLQAKLDVEYPGYTAKSASFGITVYRADVDQELKRREAEEKEASDARVAELERTLQQAIIEACEKGERTGSYVAPSDKYSLSDVGQVCVKMRAKGYSFDGFTSEDYDIVCADFAIKFTFSNEKLAQLQQQTPEQTPSEQPAA